MKLGHSLLNAAIVIGGAAIIPPKASATPAAPGLSDPELQPKFDEPVPNALDPGFLYKDLNDNGGPAWKPDFEIRAQETLQETGLIDPSNGSRLETRVWGYGTKTVSWPGQTFQVMSKSAGGADETVVKWENDLGKEHLLPVDESLHWAYSLHGASSANLVDYRQYSIATNGVPIITHLHGGKTDPQFDGNPEYFYNRPRNVIGPQWDFVPGGFTNTFRYDNDMPAGNLWYHDHALGLTRLNVYAGLAGFYFVRDLSDTGKPGNPLGLPAFPYELAYAIQDRMFTDAGALFYPAFPGDPFYEDFIVGEGAVLPPDLFPGGGPTALAEFFGDHMVVNGKIWPKAEVEPRYYRMHLLNGCDSRFLVIQFVKVDAGDTDLSSASDELDFLVIGSDQGLGTAKEDGSPTLRNTLVVEPGGRYDILFNFEGHENKRVVMKNIGGDEPFGGDIPGPQAFGETDRIMAFDVNLPLDGSVPDIDPDNIALPTFPPANGPSTDKTRRVALFEGLDEFGRLQPLLGMVKDGKLTRASDVSAPFTWFQNTTETPAKGDTEVWEIYNWSGDAHPVHLHLVNFEILDRRKIKFEEVFDPDGDEGTDYQVIRQHSGATGKAPIISRVKEQGPTILSMPEYFENAPKDMVTALPGQVTRIKVTFEKAGRYVWHCHILSHEDHEMMRVMEVVEE